MSESVKCPRCHTSMELRFSRQGNPFWGCSNFPECRGSRDYELPAATATTEPAADKAPLREHSQRRRPRDPLTVGQPVLATSNDLGVGRITQVDGKVARVEYFDSPGQPAEDRYSEFVLLSNLLPYSFVSETRVFFEHEDQWRSGRVDYQSPDGQVAVRVNDGMRMVPPDALHVRWDRPLEDPTGYARAGLFESPHNWERRSPVLRGISEQLRATRGMPGLLSISAELHAHQVATARKVLDDHTQRYLLADEVGLGKTIEALLILRQLLLDNPKTKAELIVPDHLVGQWESEIETKLLPSHFPWADVRVSRHSEPETWEDGDVLIVDEAHGLVTSESADELRGVAHASPRLLLLSATPALHNEERFLEMLHLLDPTVYPRDGIAALRSRIEGRRDLGRALVGLLPQAPAFALAGSLRALRETLAEEEELLELVEGVSEAANAEVRAMAVTDLRGAVADVFQVHRRMIRNRRTDELIERFPTASRHGTRRLEIRQEHWQTAVQALERYAEAAAEQGETAADSLIDVVSAFPDVDAMRLAANGTEISVDSEAADDWLPPTALGIADALTYEISVNDNPVVFAPTPRLAHAIADGLRELLGRGKVAVVTTGDSSEQVQTILEGFSAKRGRWLVCDSSLQEGANLQHATVMVHVGLPGRVDVLEQRIGRIDRWTGQRGGATPWRSLTVTPELGLMARWATVVDEGFEVHSRSLASLQRAVEELSRSALLQLSDAGTDGSTVIARVRSRLEEELTAVREQDAIDEMTLDPDERKTVAAMLDVDSSADHGFARAFCDLMTDRPGHLRFIRAGNPATGVGRFEFNDPATRKDGLLPLVPLRRLRTGFLSIKEQGYAGPRDVAVATNAAPIRLGTPVVDAVEDFLRHDDRGRAWSMWRYDPTYEGSTEAWWRLDLAVRARVNEAPDGIDPVVLQRQLDGVMPPSTLTIWIAGSATADLTIAEPPELATLHYKKSATPENGRMDRHLRASRLHVLDGVLNDRLDALVDRVRGLALAEATSDSTLLDAQSTAAEELDARIRRQLAALRRRRTASEDELDAVESDMALLMTSLNLGKKAIAEPNIGIDAIGLVIVSSEWPWEPEDARQ